MKTLTAASALLGQGVEGPVNNILDIIPDSDITPNLHDVVTKQPNIINDIVYPILVIPFSTGAALRAAPREGQGRAFFLSPAKGAERCRPGGAAIGAAVVEAAVPRQARGEMRKRGVGPGPATFPSPSTTAVAIGHSPGVAAVAQTELLAAPMVGAEHAEQAAEQAETRCAWPPLEGAARGRRLTEEDEEAPRARPERSVAVATSTTGAAVASPRASRHSIAGSAASVCAASAMSTGWPLTGSRGPRFRVCP